MIDSMTFTQLVHETSTSAASSEVPRERLLVQNNVIGIQIKSFLSVTEEHLAVVDLTFQDCPEEK